LIAALDAEKAYELHQMKNVLEALAADTSKGAGLRMLKQTMARLVRGEIGLRLEIWRQLLHAADRDKAATMQAALLAKMREDSRGTGLKAMRQVMVRLVKGEVSMRLMIWRTALQEERQAEELALIKLQHETTVADLRDASLHSALQQIRQFWARILKDEIGYRVLVWRNTMEEEKRIEDGSRVRRGLEALANDSLKAAGLRMMTQTMLRLARGEQAVMISQWRQGTEAALHAEKVSRVERELKFLNSESAKGQGLKMMAQIMTRAVKGELGMRILIWRTTMSEWKRLDALSAMRRELDSKAAHASRGAGIRQLKQVMIRLAKGEIAMRIEIWKTQLKMDAYAKYIEMQAILEGEMETQGRGAGLRMLRQIMARQLKGEVGMRLVMWRAGIRIDASTRQAVLKASSESQLRTRFHRGSLQMMRLVMGRMLRRTQQTSLTAWRTGMAAAFHTKALSRVKREMESRSHVTRACAVRILAQTVGRMQRNTMLVSIEAWRAGLQLATFEKHTKMQEALQAQLAQHTQSQLAALSPTKTARR